MALAGRDPQNDIVLESNRVGFTNFGEGVQLVDPVNGQLRQTTKNDDNRYQLSFRISVFGGYCSAAGAKVITSMGANSMNPISDVSLPILGSIRQTVDIPLDVYIIIVDAFGGMFRAYETPEIARVASPCYFKIEPGTSEGDIYKPWVTEGFHDKLIRQKVKLGPVHS